MHIIFIAPFLAFRRFCTRTVHFAFLVSTRYAALAVMQSNWVSIKDELGAIYQWLGHSPSVYVLFSHEARKPRGAN